MGSSDAWKMLAACGNHPSPDWWFPDHGGGATAKRICTKCPVRRQCGQDAVDRDERWGIAAGFRCTDPDERAELRIWLGLPVEPAGTVHCRDCQSPFQTRRRHSLCPTCRGSIDTAAVRKHIAALRDAEVPWREIAVAALVSPSTVRGLLQRPDGTAWRMIALDKAERILAIPVPERAL